LDQLLLNETSQFFIFKVILTHNPRPVSMDCLGLLESVQEETHHRTISKPCLITRETIPRCCCHSLVLKTIPKWNHCLWENSFRSRRYRFFRNFKKWPLWPLLSMRTELHMIIEQPCNCMLQLNVHESAFLESH